MDTIVYRPLVISDSSELRDAALKSWTYTYKDIYSIEFITNFVNENYSSESIRNALNWSKENSGWNYVATDKNKIVGFITIGKSGDQFRLYRIYLLPEYFGKGIGSELLSFGEEFLKNQNASKYIVFVHKNNLIGRNFYLKKGFVPVESKDDADEIYLEKILI